MGPKGLTAKTTAVSPKGLIVNHRPVAQVSAYLAQVHTLMVQVPTQVAQVPKYGRDLRRESAPDAILVAQVSHLKWNLLHPSRHLLHPTRHLLHKSTLNVTLLAQVPDAGCAGPETWHF